MKKNQLYKDNRHMYQQKPADKYHVINSNSWINAADVLHLLNDKATAKEQTERPKIKE